LELVWYVARSNQIKDNLISPEQFAEGMLEDLKIPIEMIMPLTSMIAKSIREQVYDYYHHAPVALIKGKDVFNQSDSPEIRIRIKLDIVCKNIVLSDEIEWDLNCKRNEPERFAESLCAELRLPNEFMYAKSLTPQYCRLSFYS
jgi:SWI/SNF-related matrix-associated actin-dependent regulator of chromatin subfamily B protein 1